MQEGDPLKQAGFIIRCSKLKESAKNCMFFSSGVILKSTNNIAFSCMSRYVERFLDKLSKIIDLLWSGCLYAPTYYQSFSQTVVYF